MVNKPNHLLVQDERAEHLGTKFEGRHCQVCGFGNYPTKNKLQRPAGRRGSFSFEPLAAGRCERNFVLFGKLHKNQSKSLCILRIDILPILCYNIITVKGNERLSFRVKRETTTEPHRPSEWWCLKRKK